MRRTLSLIGSSWDFLKRQPALLSVGFWMLFLPMLGIEALNRLQESDMLPDNIKAGPIIGTDLLILLMTVVNIWGQCCVLVPGRPLLETHRGPLPQAFPEVSP